MKYIIRIITYVSLSLLLLSCNEESDTLLSYRQDLATIHTYRDGTALYLTRDDGQNLKLSTMLKGLVADTTYRVYALYIEHDDLIELKSCSNIHSPMPESYPGAQQVRHPLDVVAAWKSGGYYNFQLRLKSNVDGKHRISFHNAGISTNADGSTTQHLTLLHHDNNAAQHFYQTVYVSCPLFTLPKTDSIRFRVTTFDGELIFE